MPIIKKLVHGENEIEYDFEGYESQKDFYTIFKKIKKTKFWKHVKVIDKVYGEDFIRYIMMSNNRIEFSLVNNLMSGNYLYITNSDYEPEMIELIEELKSLKWD